ncbi:MAG: hypothetical protein QM428_08150, partial [Verrucomicrobiota bacterium]|nr:hypothetical protein [Verrucomicrobiota bacterium]
MSNIREKVFILLIMWVLGVPIVKGDPPPTPLPTNSPSLKSVEILIKPTALQTNTPSASQTSSTNYIQEN